MPRYPSEQRYPQQWALEKIAAEAAWQRLQDIDDQRRRLPQVDSESVTIAIVDWGIQREHEALNRDLVIGARVIPPDNGDFSDDNGHGTMLAGIIGAVRNNDMGAAGLVPGAKLLVIKFIDADTPPTASAAAEAIRYAVEQKAKIINASWHVSLDQKPLRDAIEDAGKEGILVVAGAGNNGSNNTITPFLPASYSDDYDNLISVMASDEKDHKAGFSNYGDNVHLAAPGRRILSTSIYRTAPPSAGAPQSEYNPAYRLYDGTSSAAAFVSGAAAMLLSIGSWTPREVRDHLIASADECDDLRGVCQANGRLNLYRAVRGPFSITAPYAGTRLQRGVQCEVQWKSDYDSPVIKTVEISLVGGERLTPDGGVSDAAGRYEVTLPNRPIPNAVLRLKCPDKNLYADSAPFVIE